MDSQTSQLFDICDTIFVYFSGMKFTQRGLAVLDSIIPDLLNILSDKWSGG